MVPQDLVPNLLLDVLFAENPLEVWTAVGATLAQVAHAETADVYIYDHHVSSFRCIESSSDGLASAGLSKPIRKNVQGRPHVAFEAMDTQLPVVRQYASSAMQIALPLHDQPAIHEETSLVFVLTFAQCSSDGTPLDDIRRAVDNANAILSQIWPICTYARLKVPVKKYEASDLDGVAEDILSQLCQIFGFDFAALHITAPGHPPLRRAMTTKNLEWLLPRLRDPQAYPASSHRIAESDGVHVVEESVSVDTSRTRNPDTGGRVVKIIAPIGTSSPIGTIEAGVVSSTSRPIPPSLYKAIYRYAQKCYLPLRNAINQADADEFRGGVANFEQFLKIFDDDLGSRSGDGVFNYIVALGNSFFGSDISVLFPMEFYNRNQDYVSQLLPPFYYGEFKGSGRPVLPDIEDGQNIVGYVANVGSYLRENVATDTYLISSPGPEFTFSRRQGIRSFAGLRLEAHGIPVAVLCLNFREQRRFTDVDRFIFDTFSLYMGAHIYYDQLLNRSANNDKVWDWHDGVKTPLRGVQNFINSAIQILSTNVHDSSVEAAVNNLHASRHAIRETLSNIDIIVNSNNPMTFVDPSKPLEKVIQSRIRAIMEQLEVLRQIGEKSVPRIDCSISWNIPVTAPKAMATAFCLINEALTNAVEHADADNIHIRVQSSGAALLITVRDDGRGFDSDQVQGEEHRGLGIMRKRVRAANGRMHVVTCQEGSRTGTTLTFTLPLFTAPRMTP